MSKDLASVRQEYGAQRFSAELAGVDPVALFELWLDESARGGAADVNAICVATVAQDGTPSNRMVLLKHVDAERGAFSFYTNLESRKSRELQSGERRAALCWWSPRRDESGLPVRQVRIVGEVVAVSRADAQRYFATRPAAARAGAIGSPQSRAIVDRSVLEQLVAGVDADAATIPDTWGGWSVIADEIELWQGRAGRVHDRFGFLRLDEDGQIRSQAGVEAAGGEAAARAAGTVVYDAHGRGWLRARLAP